MATDRLQGDLVGWRINMKQFWLGKTIEISFLDGKPHPAQAVCGIGTHDLPVTHWW